MGYRRGRPIRSCHACSMMMSAETSFPISTGAQGHPEDKLCRSCTSFDWERLAGLLHDVNVGKEDKTQTVYLLKL